MDKKYFYGYEVSDYAKERGYVDYATLAKTTRNMILCNNITSVDEFLFDHLESGDVEEYYYDGEEITREEYDAISNGEVEDKDPNELYTEYIDFFQYYLVDDAEALIKYGETVFYSDLLDCYVWAIDHYGTSWDYVLTNIKLGE